MVESKTLPTPKFGKCIVQKERTDGYWLETFLADPADKYPSLIGYGLTLGEICIFDNPRNTGPRSKTEPGESEPEWKRYLIAKPESPVAVCPSDCAGNGRKDIIICHDYGATFLNTKPDGGHISWLENPGRNEDGTLKESWKQRFIGRWPSMHRLKAGHFTQRTSLEIVAMPIVHGPFDIETPIPVFLYQRDEKQLDDVQWKRSIINDQHFTIIHDCAIKSFEGQGGLDSMFVASREGINWLYWENGEWKREHIHDGMPKEPGKNYYGCACIDVGRVGSDPAAYMMTIDPFHGTTVTALTKRKTGPGTYEWVRHVLDVYGDPKQLKNNGDGPGHHVVTADFDGDGDDECLVALFGPSPGKGVYYYKAIDLDKGIFAKWKVADESAARIAVGKFTGGTGLDFATIGYNVPLYYEEEHPRIHLYTHNFQAEAADAKSDVISSVWAGQPVYYVPKPTDIHTPRVIPLLDVADYRTQLIVLPPKYKVEEHGGDGIKTLWGEIHNGGIVRRALGVPQYERFDARLVPGFLETNEEGAIFVRFTPIRVPQEYAKAEDVPVTNSFEFTYQQLALPEELKFIRVDQLDWGSGFPGALFYNMAGIHFRFLDSTPLCNMQYWTVAKGVSAGTHNHSGDLFLEVHLSLSAGTGNGGMWRVKPGTTIPQDPNTLPDDAYEKLPLRAMEQHGGFWERGRDGKPVYNDDGSLRYPYHKWQGGTEGDNVDIWAAFEFNPKLIDHF